MKLLTFKHEGSEQIGVRQNDTIIPLKKLDGTLPHTIVELLTNHQLSDLTEKLQQYDGDTIPVDQVEYLPLIPSPGKIICIGRNYAAHAAEGGAAVLDYPDIFNRWNTSLTAHQGPIIRPTCSTMLDYEGEFAFIIGKPCRHATEENALGFIAGYSLFNDATLRNYQRKSSQWAIGKNFDQTGGFGPELVTADELPAGLEGLTLTTKLNGELMQTGHVKDLIFPIKTLVVILSECMTLEPGDVVITGTPSGVGYARKPPVWMKPDDRVEISMEGLGTLVNIIEDEV